MTMIHANRIEFLNKSKKFNQKTRVSFDLDSGLQQTIPIASSSRNRNGRPNKRQYSYAFCWEGAAFFRAPRLIKHTSLAIKGYSEDL